MSPAKVLIVVTSHDKMGSTGEKTGYYLPEVTHPTAQLEKLGIQVDVASPQGGKAPLDEHNRDLLGDMELCGIFQMIKTWKISLLASMKLAEWSPLFAIAPLL